MLESGTMIQLARQTCLLLTAVHLLLGPGWPLRLDPKHHQRNNLC